MNLDTHWQEAFAAALAAAGKNRTAVLGFHACAESELLFARALGWLVCAFHKKSLSNGSVEKRRNISGLVLDVNRKCEGNLRSKKRGTRRRRRSFQNTS